MKFNSSRSYLTLILAGTFFIGLSTQIQAQQKTEPKRAKLVNVFLGSSGDHGQLSPAASSPFSLLSIGPQTYPTTHMGYEFLAKEFLGFTHNRFEGTGCMGSGGNILLKPCIGDTSQILNPLIKVNESAGTGYYNVSFKNGIRVSLAVDGNMGMHQYSFPVQKQKKSVLIDLKHSFHDSFVAEQHVAGDKNISGWVDSKTTCNVGVFRTYFYMEFDKPVKWTSHKSALLAELAENVQELGIKIAFSSVDEAHAKASLKTSGKLPDLAKESEQKWESLLSRINVEGDSERKALFYSLLYRSLQSPFLISEPDGTHRNIDGTLDKSGEKRYHGWAIWDNYKTQLPLLSLVYPDLYQDMVSSIEELYLHGKKDFSTKSEPANSVRTEHSVVVLLDAHQKGFKVNFNRIKDSLLAENNRLDYASPDKALESAYDNWALAQVFRSLGNEQEYNRLIAKSADYKKTWIKDFKNLGLADVDRMSARKMYQGTIRQYRWSVPFDVKGLISLTGGQDLFKQQLDDFFDNDYFNRTNEPDLMAHNLYNATNTPWKAQELIHRFAVDTVINNYFNDNSRGIGAVIDRIYKNQPAAFIRTMDDDAGAMSSWFVFAAIGLQPANVGTPVYYLHAPLFKRIQIPISKNKSLNIVVKNHHLGHAYVESVLLNGKALKRNWITHAELQNGGLLEFTTSNVPNQQWGLEDKWIADINAK